MHYSVTVFKYSLLLKEFSLSTLLNNYYDFITYRDLFVIIFMNELHNNMNERSDQRNGAITNNGRAHKIGQRKVTNKKIFANNSCLFNLNVLSRLIICAVDFLTFLLLSVKDSISPFRFI